MKTKVTFNVASVLPKLQQAASIVSKKNSMPIFGDLLLTFEQGSNMMKIEASDSENWIELNSLIESAESNAKICVPATVCKALSNLKGKTVEMTIDDERFSIVCRYGNGEFNMSYDNPEQYPHAQFRNNDNTKRKSVCSNTLTSMINSVSFASCVNDMLRQQMNGIRIDFKAEGIVSAATDGRKLARYTDKTIKSDTEDCGFTLFRKPALLLANIIEGINCDVDVDFNESTARFSTEDFVITARLAEGRYPNYNSVIPTNYTNEAIVNTSEIISAIKRVSQMANEVSMLIKAVFDNGTITLYSECVDSSRSASEEVKCEYGGRKVEIGLNGGMMLDILSSVDSESFSISVEDCSRPALFKPSTNNESTEFVSILMPIMLN